MSTDKISFLPEEEATPPTISMLPENDPVIYNTEDQHKRASMMHYAMQDKSPGVVQLYAQINEGKERAMRQSAAADQDLKNQQETQKTITQVAGRAGSNLSPTEMIAIQYMATRPPTNPDTVFEEKWSANYVYEVLTDAKNKVVKEAADTDSNRVLALANSLEDITSKRNMALSLKQEVDAAYKDLPAFSLSKPGFGWVGSWVQTITPLLTNVRMRNIVPGSEEVFTGLSTILPGTNLQENVALMYLIPKDKFMPTLRAVVGELNNKNPHMAQKFLDAVISYSTDSQYLDNVFGVLDVPVPFSGAWLARSAKSATKAAENVLSGAKAGEVVEPRMLTPIEKARAQIAAQDIERLANSDKTVSIPRGMPPEALRKAADASAELEAPGVPRSAVNAPASFPEAPEGTRQTTGFRVGDREYGLDKNTVYVTPENAALIERAGGERVFLTKDGKLGVSQRVDGRWTQVETGIPVSREPQAGMRAIELGTGRTSMGTRYFDRPTVSDPITSLMQRSVTTIDEGRDLTLAEVQRAREGIQRKVTPTEIAEMQEKMMGVRALYSNAAKALDTAPIVGKTIRDPQVTLSTLGRTEEAGEEGAKVLLRQAAEKIDPSQEGNTLMKQMLSLFDPTVFYNTTQNLSREIAGRMAEGAMANSAKMLMSLTGQRVQRLTESDLAEAIKTTKDNFLATFTNPTDAIVDIKPSYSPTTNIHFLDIAIGQPKGVGFSTKESARNMALNEYKLGEGNFFIQQHGQEFFIHVPKSVDETDPLLRNTMIPTNNITPKFWGNMYIGMLRSADDTTSPFQRSARYIATNAPQPLKKAMIDLAKDVRLSKAERNELRDILNQGRLARGEDGHPGKWFETVADLEKAWQARFSKFPTENQIKVYDNYRRLNDFDGLMRTFSWHSMKNRWGAENFKFTFFDLKGQAKITSEFEGRKVDSFDFAIPRDQGVYVVDSEAKSQTFKWKSDYKNDAEFKTFVDNKLKSGYEIIQLFDPIKKPLSKDVDNAGEIYYVLTNTATSRRLSWADSLEYRAGGHHVYLHPHFIKQPMVHRDGKGQVVYSGDKTFRSGGSTEAEARIMAEKYDQARQLLLAGDDAATEAYLKANLAEDLDTWKKVFQGENALDLNAPIVYTYTGRSALQDNAAYINKWSKTLFDRDLKDHLEDAGNPAGMLNKKFLADRSDVPLQVTKNKGSENNPIYVLETAQMLDPFITVERALGQATRARYMDDYKVLAAESFVKEFGHLIRGKTYDQLARNPLYHLYHGVPDANADPVEKAAFVATQRNVRNFIGMNSELGREMNWVEGKVMNFIHDKAGVSYADKMMGSEFVQGALIPSISDPVRFMRSIAFHSKLGFFNPVQLFVQGMAMAHTLAVAGPTEAARGFAGAMIAYRGLRHTEEPAILNKYAEIASKWGWKKEDYLEAVEAWKQSGVSIVAGETAWRDDFFDPRIYKSGIGNFLDKGTMFFATGERIPRDIAYFTAFHEWKKANPTKKFDEFAAGEVQNRYQTLTYNMTRASNASIQEGIGSLPLQFTTFNIRLAEQFLGSRLTATEKAKALSTYAVLFGVPVSISIPTGFGYIPGADSLLGINPNYEDIRTEAIKRGINVHSNYFKLMHEGILSMIFEGVTGKETNIPSRWGPGSSQLLKQMLSGEKDVMEMVMGPAGSVISDAAKINWPLFTYIRSTWDSSLSGYKLMPQDIVNVFKPITTLNNAANLIVGWNTGKYFTKNNGYIGEVDKVESAMQSLLGLQPTRFEDTFKKMNIMKEIRGLQDEAGRHMGEELRAGMRAGMKGDWETFHAKLRNFNALATGSDMRPDRIYREFSRAAKGYESLFDQTNQAWKLRYPGQSAYPDRLFNEQGAQ